MLREGGEEGGLDRVHEVGEALGEWGTEGFGVRREGGILGIGGGITVDMEEKCRLIIFPRVV